MEREREKTRGRDSIPEMMMEDDEDDDDDYMHSCTLAHRSTPYRAPGKERP